VIRYTSDNLTDTIDRLNAKGYGLTFGIHSRIKKQVDEINAKTKPKESYVSNNFDLEYVPKEFAMNKISVLGEIARGAKDV